MAISPVLFIGLVCLLGGGSLFSAVEAIWLNVPNSGQRCVSEQIQGNMVVMARYQCIDQENYARGYTLDVSVTSPYGNELYKRTNVTLGQFAFTTSEYGLYMACLSLHHDQSHHSLSGPAIVNIDRKMGIQTKDWDSVAKKEKIEGVELQLRKSTEVAVVLKENQIFIKKRERKLRELSEKANQKVAQLSFVSAGVSVVVSFVQVWHLKRFFINKKLI